MGTSSTSTAERDSSATSTGVADASAANTGAGDASLATAGDAGSGETTGIDAVRIRSCSRACRREGGDAQRAAEEGAARTINTQYNRTKVSA